MSTSRPTQAAEAQSKTQSQSPSMTRSQVELLSRRIQAARGQIPCDLILKNVQWLDVFSCEWREGDVAVIDGTIVGVEAGLKAKREVDLKGKWVVPGFVDAHVHLESSMMVPGNFDRVVLPKGTTTAICDPHELANVMGPKGIAYFLSAAESLSMDLWVMMSSCVPATHLETNGGGTISAEQLLSLAVHPRALGLAEMMNMPGVLNADPEIIKKLVAFSTPQGRMNLDGHAPLLRGKDLSAYAASGVSSCHESSELEEAREKLSKGISVWIREGSVAKDLHALLPLLNLATSTSLGFCTDDRNPLDIAVEGHLDHLVRESLKFSKLTLEDESTRVAPEVIYRAASWSVARHYGLDSRATRVGAIAPGYQADLVVLDDAETCAIHCVYKKGLLAEELLDAQAQLSTDASWELNSIKAQIPEVADLKAPEGQVHVIGVNEGKIITQREVRAHNSPGVAKLSVLERYGKGSKPANAYVTGFGEKLRGAIASSVGHDSHNLIVVGDQENDMRTALSVLAQSGGGFCVVQDGQVKSHLALPMGGLMSKEDPHVMNRSLKDLKGASQAIGCELSEPFLQLAFLSLPVIPSLKLTDQGLVDVDQFKIIDVRV